LPSSSSKELPLDKKYITQNEENEKLLKEVERLKTTVFKLEEEAKKEFLKAENNDNLLLKFG
jgi:hypothetical protein